MAYSRWSHSVWYTYADVNGGFTVCGEKNFTDKEIQDVNTCVDYFRKQNLYSEEELEELSVYMRRYVREYMKSQPTKDEK